MAGLALVVAGVVCGLAAPLAGQIWRWTPAEMARHTPLNPYERFADGRPRVPDDLLRQVERLTVAQVVEVLEALGYPRQFDGRFEILRPGRKLVGRAVTAQYLPLRADVAPVLAADAKAAGLPEGMNQRVIDRLDKDDVPVIDLMGTRPGNNFGGDNLHAAIAGATGRGAVVNGTIRDVTGIYELPTQVYYRGGHPAAVRDVWVAGINIPVRIGDALVMPGDVVLGDRTGVVFIPPHLVTEVIGKAGR